MAVAVEDGDTATAPALAALAPIAAWLLDSERQPTAIVPPQAAALAVEQSDQAPQPAGLACN